MVATLQQNVNNLIIPRSVACDPEMKSQEKDILQLGRLAIIPA
jgi:hypothetical protein